MATRTLKMTPVVRRALRAEIYDFLKLMSDPQPDNNWPAIPREELLDAVADSIIQLGGDDVSGAAMLQTLVFDLQEKVNAKLNVNPKG